MRSLTEKLAGPWWQGAEVERDRVTPMRRNSDDVVTQPQRPAPGGYEPTPRRLSREVAIECQMSNDIFVDLMQLPDDEARARVMSQVSHRLGIYAKPAPKGPDVEGYPA